MEKYFSTFVVLLCALCWHLPATAQTAGEFFMLGNSAYKKADYKAAEENYAQAIKNGAKSAEVYFNAANACAKLGMNSRAQLYYLRALLKNPRMREAAANLEILANDTQTVVPEKTLADSVFAELSESEWLAISTAAFWAAILLFVLPPLYGKRNAAVILASIILVATACFAAAGVFKWRIFKARAIAIGDNAALRISPAKNAPISAIISDGQMTAISKRHGDFIYVETPSGKRGWASLTQFEPIEE